MDLLTNNYITLANPLSRPDLAANLLDRLIAGAECISLSAPNNFGKTHFLRQMVAASTLRRHSNLHMVFIDCNLRADDSQQAFYELILKELLTIFNNSELEKLYRELVASPTRNSFQINHLFLVVFEVIRELLLKSATGKNRLVLVLDEFDQICSKLPAGVFRHLRGIKDRHGKGLVYLVGTNRPLLASEREEEEDVAEFYELFDLANLIHLHPLSRVESNELVCSHLPVLPTEILGWVYELAGGHPGLTLRLIQLLDTEREHLVTSLEEFKTLARLDPQLKLECRRIWNSLDPMERIALLQGLEGIKTLTVDPLLGTLEERGLVRPASNTSSVSDFDGGSKVFATAFKWFLEERLQFEKERTVLPNLGYSSPTASGSTGTPLANRNALTSLGPASQPPTASKAKITFDPVHEIIIFEVEGERDKPKTHLPLTGNTALLFKYLFLRQSIPYCSKDELISAVWGQEAAYSSENLDRLVSDLRQLIGDHDKQIIRTIHRRGLQMVGVKEWRPVTSENLDA